MEPSRGHNAWSWFKHLRSFFCAVSAVGQAGVGPDENSPWDILNSTSGPRGDFLPPSSRLVSCRGVAGPPRGHLEVTGSGPGASVGRAARGSRAGWHPPRTSPETRATGAACILHKRECRHAARRAKKYARAQKRRKPLRDSRVKSRWSAARLRPRPAGIVVEPAVPYRPRLAKSVTVFRRATDQTHAPPWAVAREGS